jgi:hypothetical protein
MRSIRWTSIASGPMPPSRGSNATGVPAISAAGVPAMLAPRT